MLHHWLLTWPELGPVGHLCGVHCGEVAVLILRHVAPLVRELRCQQSRLQTSQLAAGTVRESSPVRTECQAVMPCIVAIAACAMPPMSLHSAAKKDSAGICGGRAPASSSAYLSRLPLQHHRLCAAFCCPSGTRRLLAAWGLPPAQQLCSKAGFKGLSPMVKCTLSPR